MPLPTPPLPADALDLYRAELRAFLQALPGLLADGHEGKHVLIKGDQVLTVWDTFGDALQAGYERFGWGERFLCQPIDREFLTYPWPEDILPRAGRTAV